jgi:cell division protein FtsI/penicillin-binding protein 2
MNSQLHEIIADRRIKSVNIGLCTFLYCITTIIWSCSKQPDLGELINLRITDTMFNEICHYTKIDSFKIFILDTKEDEIVFSKVFERAKSKFVSSKTSFENNQEPGGLFKPFWAAVLIEKAGFEMTDKIEYKPEIKIYDHEIKDRFDLKVDSVSLFKSIVYSSNTGIIGFLKKGEGNAGVREILDSLQPKEIQSGVSSAYAALGYNIKFNTKQLMDFYGEVANKKLTSEFSENTLIEVDTILANIVRVGSCKAIDNRKNPIHGKSATTPRFNNGLSYDSRFIGFENSNRRFVVYVIVSGRELNYGSQSSAKIGTRVLKQLRFTDETQ